MNAIQQKCRPKHQVLVLKCYPRTAKGAVDVKPNASELSYLLFYATSRRSKIQKIGAFLEKKTASDVWRMRIGNVQVTLAILTALVDKSPKDFALVAPCVLKILNLVLRSQDVTMIESSLPTFEAFCDHHDASSLFADHAYLQQYQAIVASYAQLASSQRQHSDSRPVQMRWRNAGLEAIRCVSASDALASLTGRQIDTIVPVILDNLWIDEDDLDVLLDRVQSQDKVDLGHRRNSVASVRQTDGAGDTHPLALSGTALDADKLAEENLGVLAVQCLKSIFMVPNRAQIHAATTAFVSFVSQKVGQGAAIVNRDRGTARDSGWAIKLYRACARWAPVQDRYVILLAARDTMVKTPLTEAKLAQHLALAGMMQSILRSDVNLIGLSVMDVVVGLVRQIRKLLQLSGRAGNDDNSQNDEKAGGGDDDFGLSSRQGELLERLEGCIGDLATHVYYADQIVDMVSALIARLSPSRSESASSLPLGEKSAGNEDEASAAGLGGSQSPSHSASSSKALRLSALRVMKRILVVANPRAQAVGSLNLSRNRVPISVWEGSQWLLRDADGAVRKAYVDALVTWLERETTRADGKVLKETPVHRRSSVVTGGRRAVSLASNRDGQPKAQQCQFLAFLHLAVYESALHFIDCNSDIALLHNMMTRLVLNLGVNAARYGIPMVYRLQEEVQLLELPIHKVRIAALCHGYFWALLEKFNLDSTGPGRAINNEITRRRSKGFWVDEIRVPPPSLDMIGRLGRAGPQPSWDVSKLESEELLPFDDRISLVECISVSYYESNLSPPSSPGAHGGSRTLSNPLVGSPLAADAAYELPNSLRDDMLAEWTKESAAAAVDEARADSVSGSRTGGAFQNRSMNASVLNGNGSTLNLRPLSTQAQGYGDRLSTLSRLRNASIGSARSPVPSVSSKGGIASVQQLKMILAGNASPQTVGIPGVQEEEQGPGDDDDDESMMSYDYCPSDGSFSPTAQAGEQPTTATTGEALAKSIAGSLQRPRSSSRPPIIDGESKPQGVDHGAQHEEVPPVPPLPGAPLSSRGSTAVQDFATGSSRRNVGSRDGRSVAGRSVKSRRGISNRGINLDDFLENIDSRSGDEGVSLGNMVKPPY